MNAFMMVLMVGLAPLFALLIIQGIIEHYAPTDEEEYGYEANSDNRRPRRDAL